MSEHEGVRLDSIERAIADFRDGKAIVVVDDEGRENEGDIIFAASKATPELMAFLVRYSSGLICAPITGEILDRLAIPLMTPHNREKMRTAYTVSIDARDGITTGISATDRARTCRVLADSATEPFELNQPGHIIPLRAKPGGVLERDGHTEAAVDFARLAGLTPAGVIGEVLNDDGTLMRAPSCGRSPTSTGWRSCRSRTFRSTVDCTSRRLTGWPRPACPRSSASSRRTATATGSRARSTSPWSSATPAPRTPSCASTPSA
ncbi:3,4-dihydroxy-2-butanone-4-phosphate synthase [Aeromicrobium sp. UC242_57]|uniref:3,4-dihydroxy-2-butanone-4-phosphate synthase n=1 Tax=Aeromicrobium sp. UC242_57 TaxID=3374624 RepID=UPI0037BCD263